MIKNQPDLAYGSVIVAATVACSWMVSCAADDSGNNDALDSGKDDVSVSSKPLRVASWNTQNFFDNVKGNCLKYCPYEDVLTLQAYNTKVEGLARGLKLLQANIVLLQEVENQQVLDKLASHSDLASLNYSVRIIEGGNDPRGITLGLLSNVPIGKYISHAADKFTRRDAPHTVYRFARDVAEIHFEHQGAKVFILNVHFKARTNDTDPDRRIAEAQQTRKIADSITNTEPRAFVLIAGDVNDTEDTLAYKALRDGDGNEAPSYVALLNSVPSAQRYSYTYRGRRVLLDHLFVSQDFAEKVNYESVEIIHDSTLPSDHAPVVATFTLP